MAAVVTRVQTGSGRRFSALKRRAKNGRRNKESREGFGRETDRGGGKEARSGGGDAADQGR